MLCLGAQLGQEVSEFSQRGSQLVPAELWLLWALFGPVGCPRFVTGQPGLVYPFKKLKEKKSV